MAASAAIGESAGGSSANSLDNVNYILEITLLPNAIPKKQQPTRTLSVPACTNFNQLHEGIYVAFQWDDFHLFDFRIHNCSEWTKKTENQARRDRDADLLSILDWPYNMGFGPPEMVAKEVILGSVLEDSRYKGKVLEYTWDGWSHVIVVKGRVAGTGHMELISGKWKPPADYAPFAIAPFTDEDKEVVISELNEVVCGVDEEDEDEDGEAEPVADENDDDVNGEDDSVANAAKAAEIASKSKAIEERMTGRVAKLAEDMINDFKRELPEAELDRIMTKVFQHQFEMAQQNADKNGIKRRWWEAECKKNQGRKPKRVRRGVIDRLLF